MMVAVVYLSSKLGLVTGQGLFAVIRDHYSRWFLYSVLAGVLVGNLIEAGADNGGMAAALNVIVPLPIGVMVVLVGVAIFLASTLGILYVPAQCVSRACARTARLCRIRDSGAPGQSCCFARILDTCDSV
jgi:Mn2+/Fe2+ NRAMP family transporter